MSDPCEELITLRRIADALEEIARQGRGAEPAAPNYERDLAGFAAFDWTSIGASVVSIDEGGATHVEWGGMIWTRRSPANKFDPAIWYSRSAGKDEDGTVRYLRLITFRTIGKADPLPEQLASTVRRQALTQASLLSMREYIEEATAEDRHGLSREAAEYIANLAGCKDPGSDFTQAAELLPFFAEAKRRKLRLTEAGAILQQCQMHPGWAAEKLETLHPTQE